MLKTIEAATPYHQSLQWRIHDAYFVAKGRSAWTQNTIPSAATNNAPIARQHIEVLLTLLEELESRGVVKPGEGIAVLELGSGAGRFAALVFEALEHDFGDRGHALRDRLTWILSDFTRRTLEQTIATPDLAELVASRRVVPALHDLRVPGRLEGLDGEILEGRVVGVVASYVGCVLPVRYLRRHGPHWSECWVSLQAELSPGLHPDEVDVADIVTEYLATPTQAILSELTRQYEWRPVVLDELFDDPIHAQILRDTTDALETATVPYPELFLDTLRDAGRLLVDGGLMFVNDLGHPSALALAGEQEPRVTLYGNTLNHALNFALLEPLARHASLGLLRTVGPVSQLQQAVVRHGPPLTQALEDVFRQWYVDRTEHQDLLDFESAGQQAYRDGDYARAIRLYRRCLLLSPREPGLLYGLGRACLYGGFLPEAVEALEAGFNLDAELYYDFDFHLGRAWATLGYYEKALSWYEHSVGRDPHPVTWSNMAEACYQMSDHDAAYMHWRRALLIDPAHASALEGIERLKQLFFQQRVADLEAQLEPTNTAGPTDTPEDGSP